MKRQQTGSIIFLTELLLALTIFALCASVCARLLVMSYNINRDSGTLNRALTATQSCAEAFKRYPALQELTGVLKGEVVNDACVVYYNESWKTTNAYNASFVIRINLWDEDGLRFARVTATDMEGDFIYSIDASSMTGEAVL